ncbi:MAG: type II secretion system F family protein [Phycisphaerales bacterium]|nr:type II secretion system F family protein [Phycisphaerales bacterium]
MPTFSYKAKTSTGQTVSGVLTAESQQAVMRMLDERSLFPLRVTEGGQAEKSAFTGQRKKLSLRILTAFYSQLSDLLRAGVPVLRAIDVLARQEANPLLTEILREVHNDVSSGTTLADAMLKHPNAFNSLAVAMVRAGEQGGFLEDVLQRIAIFTERQDELRNKLIGSMVYPCILVMVGLVVVSFLMVWIVPKIRPLIERIEKPWITTVLFAISDFIINRWPYVIGGIVLLIMVALMVLKSEQGRVLFEKLKLKIPVLGGIIQMVAICRFCRILGTLLHNGVPILQALGISKDATGSQILAEEIAKASESVQQGHALAAPLAKSGLFPMDIIDMVAVAEESNNLENVLVQIAESNEARTGRQIDLGVRMLEPLMLMVMAIFVAFIAIGLLVPILRSGTAAH